MEQASLVSDVSGNWISGVSFLTVNSLCGQFIQLLFVSRKKVLYVAIRVVLALCSMCQFTDDISEDIRDAGLPSSCAGEPHGAETPAAQLHRRYR